MTRLPMTTLPAKLHGSIVPLSPTTVWRWARCRRLYLLRNLVQLPGVDAGPWSAEGSRIHAVLNHLHREGSCRDANVVERMVASYAHGDDERLRGFITRHARRCPVGDARYEGGEVPLGRFHRSPPPLFTVSASIDALWVHDGILDARDYKTGAGVVEDLSRDVRARAQAWLLDARARALGLRLRLRYEFLAPEIADDPSPWDPEPDEIDEIEEELRRAAESIRAEREFRGVGEPAVCRTCEYRSICADAAPGSDGPENAVEGTRG
ncbi:MAG: PD-(D/E)XK nuclease family protein [Actinobacteria bacterium]|nr:PD-(D/E)XK nuclease family protein [Actinomycetota bacterium]